jgi:outer membrane protein assembly factor BamB
MNSQVDQATLSDAPHIEPSAPRPPRTWPAIWLLCIFWSLYFVLRWTEWGVSLGFAGFLALFGGGALTMLLFAVWWLTASRLAWAERFEVLGVAVLAGVGAGFLADKTSLALLFMPGLPLVLTAWSIGLIVARHWRSSRRVMALAGLICLTWSTMLLFRTQGVSGDFQTAIHWRWTPTAERHYLADPIRNPESSTIQDPLTLRAGDWPGFRGDERAGEVREVRIATDWDPAGPKLLWRRRIGPAWSSVAVVGDRLFTQEQLGEDEAVVCLDAATGKTLWSHKDEARHEDGQSEAGPRATPTFADGRIFTLGATGILNCLDAATGEIQWSRDIKADSGTNKPVWGFSSSPLVAEGLVIVFAGSEQSESQKTLLAYHTSSGEPSWSAAAGNFSYCSPQLALVGDTTQLLFVSEEGLLAFDPSSGAVLWQYGAKGPKWGIPQTVQPRAIGGDSILFDAGADVGTSLIAVTHNAEVWKAEERWLSRQLKPSFNDFVVHDQAIFGFDNRVFTCVDLQSGKRRWKSGRYGSGQVLLLRDQGLLLIVSDEGDVVLVPADPNSHRELARFRAVEGKTWNHPVIAHGHLYIRNAQEMACYGLQVAGPG